MLLCLMLHYSHWCRTFSSVFEQYLTADEWCLKLMQATVALQAAVRYSCGSSCWNSWPTQTVSTSSRGRATAGSSASAIQTRSLAAGAPARRNRRWTTKNSAAAFAITTIRTLSTKRPVDDTFIGLSVIWKTCWDAPLISCLPRAE